MSYKANSCIDDQARVFSCNWGNSHDNYTQTSCCMQVAVKLEHVDDGLILIELTYIPKNQIVNVKTIVLAT